MSDLTVASLRGRKSGTAPKISGGAVITGIATATSFGGNLTGNVTGIATGNVTGNVTGVISATSASLSGNVSVGGIITYEDVTSIDSVGVITARNGIKVSAGQSISAVSGIVTYYGDGSQLSGVESGVVNFVASGTIPNGATVVINTDGTVGIVTLTTSSTPSVGSKAVFNAGNATLYMSSAYDSANNKVVIVYNDQSNTGDGTAIVGTVSGSSITFGSEVVFDTGSPDWTSCVYDSTNEKVVIAYRDSSNSSYGTAIVGTVSGTSISFGSEVVFNTGNTPYTAATFDSTNGKVVIAYADFGDSGKGKAIVGTVSGTSISFGSEAQFNAGSIIHTSATYDSANQKVVITYSDSNNSSYGTAVIGTVSSSTITFGSEVVFNAGNTGATSATFDSTNNKVVIAYRDDANSNYGTARVGTVSGTSISFGTAVVFNNTGSTDYIKSAYDSTNSKVVIAYQDNANSNYGTAIVGTVSGTSISFGSEIVFNTGAILWLTSTYDSTNDKVIFSYADNDNSYYGTSIVLSTQSQTTNLTTSNYIGIAAEAISNTATGRINVVTGTNSGQTGLTTAQKYYVQSSGGISTTASSPSVVAGTSISDTKIIVQKS